MRLSVREIFVREVERVIIQKRQEIDENNAQTRKRDLGVDVD
jgi:hypothetical protein